MKTLIAVFTSMSWVLFVGTDAIPRTTFSPLSEYARAQIPISLLPWLRGSRPTYTTSNSMSLQQSRFFFTRASMRAPGMYPSPVSSGTPRTSVSNSFWSFFGYSLDICVSFMRLFHGGRCPKLWMHFIAIPASTQSAHASVWLMYSGRRSGWIRRGPEEGPGVRGVRTKVCISLAVCLFDHVHDFAEPCSFQRRCCDVAEPS